MKATTYLCGLLISLTCLTSYAVSNDRTGITYTDKKSGVSITLSKDWIVDSTKKNTDSQVKSRLSKIMSLVEHEALVKATNRKDGAMIMVLLPRLHHSPAMIKLMQKSQASALKSKGIHVTTQNYVTSEKMIFITSALMTKISPKLQVISAYVITKKHYIGIVYISKPNQKMSNKTKLLQIINSISIKPSLQYQPSSIKNTNGIADKDTSSQKKTNAYQALPVIINGKEEMIIQLPNGLKPFQMTHSMAEQGRKLLDPKSIIQQNTIHTYISKEFMIEIDIIKLKPSSKLTVQEFFDYTNKNLQKLMFVNIHKSTFCFGGRKIYWGTATLPYYNKPFSIGYGFTYKGHIINFAMTSTMSLPLSNENKKLLKKIVESIEFSSTESEDQCK